MIFVVEDPNELGEGLMTWSPFLLRASFDQKFLPVSCQSFVDDAWRRFALQYLCQYLCQLLKFVLCLVLGV